jgi:hypothetical protein
VSRRRRLFSALTPATLILLIAVSPAVQRQDGTRHVVRVGAPAIRAVDSSLASLSAGVAERVPVPSIRPMQAAAVDGVARPTVLSWLVIVLAALLVLGCIALPRRDRAPPRRLLVRA